MFNFEETKSKRDFRKNKSEDFSYEERWKEKEEDNIENMFYLYPDLAEEYAEIQPYIL